MSGNLLHRSRIVTREQVIQALVAGRSVLDVGCVDHTTASMQRADWLHGFITRHASSVLGVDLCEAGVAQMNANGYQAVCGDATTMEFNRAFDVVVAGELIEHLENPGSFLTNMRQRLVPRGRIVLTTPTPFWPKYSLQVLARGRVGINPEHVMWFCPVTLEALLARCGYVDVQIYFSNRTKRWLGIGGLPSALRRWFCTNLIAVARRAGP